MDRRAAEHRLLWLDEDGRFWAAVVKHTARGGHVDSAAEVREARAWGPQPGRRTYVRLVSDLRSDSGCCSAGTLRYVPGAVSG